MHVTTAFLYAPLELEVYMEAPHEPREENMVWVLLKCLYGIKQAPRGWNHHINDVLKGMKFHRLQSHFGLYILGEGPETLYLALYVDDLLLLCIDIKDWGCEVWPWRTV